MYIFLRDPPENKQKSQRWHVGNVPHKMLVEHDSIVLNYLRL
jgi:hypothetical protein